MDSRALRRILGQILVGSLTLRGFACSYPKRYIVPAEPSGDFSYTRDLSSKECERLCAPLLGRQSGCGLATSINDCVIAWDPARQPAPVKVDDFVVSGSVEDGLPVIVCSMQMDPVRCGSGRRPSGLVFFEEPSRGGPLGAHLAELARLEAASVPAFLELQKELAAHGAPARLVLAAARAAIEEARHARVMSELARRFGGDPRPVFVEHPSIRSLEEVAMTNAVEGCIRETYGAIVAGFQAASAQDTLGSGAMGTISEDEAAHAGLAWTVHAWIWPLLSNAAKRRVAETMVAAMDELIAEASVEPESPLTTLLGVPGAEEASFIARGLAERLGQEIAPR